MGLLDGILPNQFVIFKYSSIFVMLFLVLAFGYLIYIFLLTMRVRILADTVKTPNNKIAKFVSYAHLIFAVIGSGVAVILILLG